MADISQELDPPVDCSPQEQLNKRQGAQSDRSSRRNSTSNSTYSIFPFRFKLSIAVAFLSIAIIFPSLREFPDPQFSSFLRSLPASLEHHYLKGELINIHINQHHPPIEIFKFESENRYNASENVLIVHGIGMSSFAFRKVVNVLENKGVHAISFDLPGHGFSKTLMEETWEERGIFEKLASVYNLIKEKGVFWAVETAIETGVIPYEEIELLLPREHKVSKPAALGNNEMGKILGDLIDKLGLAPVHLVLHDSSIAMVGYWVSENPNVIKSLTLLNPSPKPAFPLGFLKLPPVFLIASRYNAVYGAVIRRCCSCGMSISDLVAHRMMFRNCAATMINKIDQDFHLKNWGQLPGVKTMPLHVISSGDWSSGWNIEKSEVAEGIGGAGFASYSGGRWPNEESSKEIGDLLYDFVSSLPKSVVNAS